MIKVEKTEKINHYKQIVKSLYLTNIAVQNYNLTQKEKEKKMRKSNCCKAELLSRTVLCSKCLSEVKVRKLTAEDFIEDNVLKLPFKETLSEIGSVVFNGPRFNKTLIIKFELDKDGMYKYNLPEDMDRIRVEQKASYVVKYGKHVNKIKSLDEVGLTFFIRNNQVIVDAQEFIKLKKSDLVLTFIYTKKNEVHSEKNDVCDREKSLKSFIYNLNIAGIENISKDRNKILKSNLDFLQLLSYANVNLHVTRFMDSGNGEVHVDFGTGFLPSIGPSVFTFITKWEYLDQILIKKMVVPISPVPMSKCSLEVPISKCSLDNLPLPIKIGDKVLFQNRHALLKYFNIGYHVLNMAFDNKYIIQNIYKTEDLFVITISDNYDLYKSHPLSHVDIFTLFGSNNTLGVIVNPDQKYGRKVTTVSPVQKKTWRKTPSILRNDGSTILKLFDFVNVLGDDVAYETIFEDSKDCVKIVAMINEKEKLRVLDISTTGNEFVLKLGSGYIFVTSKPLSLEEVEKYFVFNSESPNSVITVKEPEQPVHDIWFDSMCKVLGIDTERSLPSFRPINLNYGFMEVGQIYKDNIKSRYNLDGMGYFKALERKMGNEPKETTGKGERVKIDFADESNFFITDNTEDKKFDEPIKDEKIVPARIDDDNLFSIGDYVTIKDKDLEKGIANGIIKNPFGWGIFDTVDDPYVIVHSELNIKNTETIYVFRKGESYYGFTVEADKAKEIIRKILFTVTGDNIEEDEVDNTIKPKTKGRKTDKEKGEAKK